MIQYTTPIYSECASRAFTTTTNTSFVPMNTLIYHLNFRLSCIHCFDEFLKTNTKSLFAPLYLQLESVFKMQRERTGYTEKRITQFYRIKGGGGLGRPRPHR